MTEEAEVAQYNPLQNGNVKNQDLAPVQYQQQQQVAQGQPAYQQPQDQQYMAPRAEGYRRHAIRESRIKGPAREKDWSVG